MLCRGALYWILAPSQEKEKKEITVGGLCSSLRDSSFRDRLEGAHLTPARISVVKTQIPDLP